MVCKSAQALAVEEAPDSKAIQVFNEELASKNDMLAPVVADSIRYGSLACSHTNQFLRCVLASVPSDDDILSEGGRLSLAKLRERGAEFASACENGLKWTVLSHKVRARFPAVLGLLQESRNATGQVAIRENEVQVLLRLHGLATRDGQQIDWKSIQRAVIRTRPPCADDVPDCFNRRSSLFT